MGLWVFMGVLLYVSKCGLFVSMYVDQNLPVCIRTSLCVWE